MLFWKRGDVYVVNTYCILYRVRCANSQLQAKTTHLSQNCKYALDDNFYGHFCSHWKAANFCDPGIILRYNIPNIRGDYILVLLISQTLSSLTKQFIIWVTKAQKVGTEEENTNKPQRVASERAKKWLTARKDEPPILSEVWLNIRRRKCHFARNSIVLIWALNWKRDEKPSHEVKYKHCQRHNGPEGWVHLSKVTSWSHIKSSYTNLDQISSSEFWPRIKFKISTKTL